jgi:glucosyl-dolichyl phosphate glucuronosyltransferase
VNVTAIVCTYNRCESLAKALCSVASSVLPTSVEWDVLVVDNNSSDQTRAVVEGFRQKYPGRFHYLFEPRQGKSYALNAGIRESRGDVLAFVDDDVTVEPTWLQNLTSAMNSEEWAGSGGRTLPASPFTPPEWLSIDEPFTWGGILGGLFDLGDKPCELVTEPYGTNMAFRRAMFDRYGYFRTDMGPGVGSEIRNEDTEFGRRLLAGGERLRYEPLAVVYHPILKNRVQRDYFLTWWFDQGRALAREEGKAPRVTGGFQHYTKIATMVAKLPVRMLRWIRSSNSPRRFFLKCLVWQTVGQIMEGCRL